MSAPRGVSGSSGRGTPTSSPSANPVGYLEAFRVYFAARPFSVRAAPCRPGRSCRNPRRLLRFDHPLVSRIAEPVHARGIRRLSHQGRRTRAVAVLWHPEGADVARTNLAARRDERQRYAVHLYRELHRRRRGAQPRQFEDRVSRPHGVAHRRHADSDLHGALQHDCVTGTSRQGA